MRKLFPLLGLALLCFASCDAPFDLSLSQAAATVGKLNYHNTIGPVTNLDGDIEAENVMFLPDKKNVDPWINYRDGFLVARKPDYVTVAYARFLSPTEYQVFGGWGGDFSSSEYEPFVFEPLKFPTGAESSIGILSDRTPWMPENRSAEIQKAQFPAPPADPFFASGGSVDMKSMSGLAGYVAGYSVSSTLGPLLDRSYWLGRVDPAPDSAFREKQFDLGSTGLMAPADVRPFQVFLPQLDGVTRCQYFYDPYPSLPENRSSYASWYDESRRTWRCISWKGIIDPPEVLELDITHRIDALLSNGLLFSTQDGVGRLFESNGNEVASFPLGSLRFVGERFLGSSNIPTVIFTLARIAVGDKTRELFIDLYTLPTADLSKL